MLSKSKCLTTVAVQSTHTMLTFLQDKCVSFACAHKHSLYQPLNGRWNFVSAIKLHRSCVGIWHIPTYVNNICTVCAWWRHQMKHFPRYWPFDRGIQRSHVNSPHKGQRRGALVFSLICAWINGGVNNREAGDLRRHRAHYDVTVMNGMFCHWTSLIKLRFFSVSCSNSFTFLNESSLTKNGSKKLSQDFCYSSCQHCSVLALWK